MDKGEILLEELSALIKSIQIQHVMNTEGQNHVKSYTDEHKSIRFLLLCLDKIFLYGLRNKQYGYWKVVHHFCQRDVLQTVSRLERVRTEIGKGRAWLLHILNEKLLESFLVTFQHNNKHMHNYYNSFAILSSNKLQLLISLVFGLEHIVFNLQLDVEHLDWSAVPIDVPYPPSHTPQQIEVKPQQVEDVSLRKQSNSSGSSVYIDTSIISQAAKSGKAKASRAIQGFFYTDTSNERTKLPQPGSQTVLETICDYSRPENTYIPSHNSMSSPVLNVKPYKFDLNAPASSKHAVGCDDVFENEAKPLGRHNPFDKLVDEEPWNGIVMNYVAPGTCRHDFCVPVIDQPIEVLRQKKPKVSERKHKKTSSLQMHSKSTQCDEIKLGRKHCPETDSGLMSDCEDDNYSIGFSSSPTTGMQIAVTSSLSVTCDCALDGPCSTTISDVLAPSLCSDAPNECEATSKRSGAAGLQNAELVHVQVPATSVPTCKLEENWPTDELVQVDKFMHKGLSIVEMAPHSSSASADELHSVSTSENNLLSNTEADVFYVLQEIINCVVEGSLSILPPTKDVCDNSENHNDHEQISDGSLGEVFSQSNPEISANTALPISVEDLQHNTAEQTETTNPFETNLKPDTAADDTDEEPCIYKTQSQSSLSSSEPLYKTVATGGQHLDTGEVSLCDALFEKISAPLSLGTEHCETDHDVCDIVESAGCSVALSTGVPVMEIDHSLRVKLMADVVNDEDEILVKMIQLSSEENCEGVFVLFTDKFLYILESDLGTYYKKMHFEYSSVQVQYLCQKQGVVFLSSDSSKCVYRCNTCSDVVSEAVVQCFFSSPAGIEPPILVDVGWKKHLSHLSDCVKLETGSTEFGIVMYRNIYWSDNRSSKFKSESLSRKGSLSFKSGKKLFNMDRWISATFILDNENLCRFKSSNTPSVEKSWPLSDLLYCQLMSHGASTFQVIGREEKMELRAKNSSDAKDWVTAIQTAIEQQNQESGQFLPCSLLVTKDQILIIEEEDTMFCRCLSKISSAQLQKVAIAPVRKSCLVHSFCGACQNGDTGICSCANWMLSFYDSDQCREFVALCNGLCGLNSKTNGC